MKFLLVIDSEDAQATDDPVELVTQCCRYVAVRVQDSWSGKLFDVNGNHVGNWTLEAPDTEDKEEDDG